MDASEDNMAIRALTLGRMAVCAFAFAAPAGAADLGRMPVKAPVVPPAFFSWTGCYLGGYVGGAWSDRDPVFTDLGNANFRAFSVGVTAVGPIQVSDVDQCASVAAGCGNWLISTAVSDTVTAGTVGGGVEWAFANNWSVKAEYMFIGLGDHDTLTSCASAFLASGATVVG